jgi:beta-glucosidase
MSELTPAQKASLTAGASMWSTVAIPNAGIPSMKMADGPMGIASGRVDERDVSVLTPCPLALGASWDAALVHRIGALVGGEAIRLGVDAVLAPNINLARSPLAGRSFEYFSEDPLLTGVLGAAWMTGVQSTGTASIPKHLVCNDSETERNSMNVIVDERALREVYLLPFEMCAAAGAAGMLTAYNKVNGDWCSEHHHIITEIVKGEWGFEGFIVSDWFGTQSTLGSISGGLDLEMPGPARFMGAKVLEVEVAPERIEDAANRVARAARRWTGAKSPPIEDADTLLIEAAAAGFVLLKNEGDLLPLIPARDKTIAVIGPNAAAPCYQGGTFAKIAVKPDAFTPIDAIRARYGDHCNIIYEPGVDPQPRLPSMLVPMTLAYFDNPDCAGTPIAIETRSTNALVWFVGVHDLGEFEKPASIRASGHFTAASSGDHIFYLGGTGSVRLLVDGTEIMRRDEEVAASDVMGKLKRGDADSAAVALEAGQTVTISIAFRYTPARVQGLWYGLRVPDSPGAMLARAVDAAAKADAVILIVGETSDNSVESKDRTSTELAAEQRNLIRRVTAANPRTAIIANVGHAFDTRWDDLAPALMLTWYPGQEFGNALAQVLAGDREPGGRMPVSIAAEDGDYPAFGLTPTGGDLSYLEGACIGYRGIAAPRHAFGSGMGYARIDWSNAAIEGMTVSLTVTNASSRAGSDVIQIYRDVPEPTLVGFAKVHLEPGETRRVSIPLDPRRLMIWNEGWKDMPRPITMRVGRAAVDTAFTVVLP